jgi:phosphoribosyl-AMP cyclohydrolase
LKKSLLTFATIVLITSVIIVGFLSLNNATSKNAGLTDEITRLKEEYAELQTKYYALLGNYNVLESKYKGVLLQSPDFYSIGGSRASDVAQYLARYEALQALYRDLQAEYSRYQSYYRALKELTDSRLMRIPLECFITPEDPAVMNITLEVTGTLGNDTDSDQYWGGIKAIYDWVNNNIVYRDDGLYPELPTDLTDITVDKLAHSNQMAQFPNETLVMRMGDCEDSAALLASMIRAYFSRQVECIWITGVNAGHVAVVIPIGGDKIVILDPIRDYYSHDTLGDISYNSISTEIYDWLNIWRPTLGNDVHVYRIFSDYMDKYFESTEEYITWQNNR